MSVKDLCSHTLFEVTDVHLEIFCKVSNQIVSRFIRLDRSFDDISSCTQRKRRPIDRSCRFIAEEVANHGRQNEPERWVNNGYLDYRACRKPGLTLIADNDRGCPMSVKDLSFFGDIVRG